jgi:hypothetical protein
MIYYMLLLCLDTPQPTTKPGDCFVIGASADHALAVETAHRWCQEDPTCLGDTYIQKVTIEPEFEKIR